MSSWKNSIACVDDKTYAPHQNYIPVVLWLAHIMKNKRFELLQMNLISPDTLFEICTYMYLKNARVS